MFSGLHRRVTWATRTWRGSLNLRSTRSEIESSTRSSPTETSRETSQLICSIFLKFFFSICQTNLKFSRTFRLNFYIIFNTTSILKILFLITYNPKNYWNIPLENEVRIFLFHFYCDCDQLLNYSFQFLMKQKRCF